MNTIKVVSANKKELNFSIRLSGETLLIVLDDIVANNNLNTINHKYYFRSGNPNEHIDISRNTPIKPEDVKNVDKKVFQFFTDNDGCPNEACKKLKEAYLKELDILSQNPATCTSCAKGALNRKYIPLVRKFYETKDTQ